MSMKNSTKHLVNTESKKKKNRFKKSSITVIKLELFKMETEKSSIQGSLLFWS